MPMKKGNCRPRPPAIVASNKSQSKNLLSVFFRENYQIIMCGDWNGKLFINDRHVTLFREHKHTIFSKIHKHEYSLFSSYAVLDLRGFGETRDSKFGAVFVLSL